MLWQAVDITQKKNKKCLGAGKKTTREIGKFADGRFGGAGGGA